jgi:hypothetical protein
MFQAVTPLSVNCKCHQYRSRRYVSAESCAANETSVVARPDEPSVRCSNVCIYIWDASVWRSFTQWRFMVITHNKLFFTVIYFSDFVHRLIFRKKSFGNWIWFFLQGQVLAWSDIKTKDSEELCLHDRGTITLSLRHAASQIFAVIIRLLLQSWILQRSS